MYIGVGVKGLGKVEILIYIDVFYVKGVINLRLLLFLILLFIIIGIFILFSMLEYDIFVNFLKKGGFNVMNLLFMKFYGKCYVFLIIVIFFNLI